MSEIMANYLGAFHGVVMALALVAAIVLRRRMRKRHLGSLVAGVAAAIAAFFGLLLASFRTGDLLSHVIHAVLPPGLAAVAAGCGALAGFTLMLAMFGLSLREREQHGDRVAPRPRRTVTECDSLHPPHPTRRCGVR